jgi:hypothetical protein
MLRMRKARKVCSLAMVTSAASRPGSVMGFVAFGPILCDPDG